MSSTEHYEPPPNGWRTFLIVWATQSVSVFGSALTFFAVNIWLLTVAYPREDQKPELAWAISAISLAFAIPIVFIAPIAGAWADRHDRKLTMMVADAISGLLSLTLLTLVATGLLNIWVLIVLMVAFATVGAFHGSAFDTSYAMIVPENQLPRANGMMQTIWSVSGIISPAIGATLVSLPGGMSLAMGIDAVTFFMAAATLLFLFIPSPVRTDLHSETGKVKKSMLADVKEGALYIWHRKPLLWLLGTFTVANFASSPMGVMQPLIVKFNLAPDWTALGLTLAAAIAVLATAASIGGLAGGIFISAWGGLKKRRVYGVLVPMIVAGVGQIVFGFSPWIFLGAAMVGLVDGMVPVMNSHSQAIWQTQTPRELQGRVFSVRRVIAQFSWPLSTALAGLLGGLFNPGVVVAVLGVILVLFCIGQFFNPVLLRVEDRDYLESLAENARKGKNKQPVPVAASSTGELPPKVAAE